MKPYIKPVPFSMAPAWEVIDSKGEILERFSDKEEAERKLEELILRDPMNIVDPSGELQ